MRKPAISIIGITQIVSFAPPVSKTSTAFIEASIEIIEISDIPIATRKASFKGIWPIRMKVSKAIEVIIPLKIARSMMLITDHAHGFSVI